MLSKLVKVVVGSRNDRLIKKKMKVVKKINSYGDACKKLSDSDLQAKTQEFKNRLKGGDVLENLIPEAFAVVREASDRVFKMRHFDVQF
ncbi:MAG: hypothetical protein KAG06_07495, partial [Methylococcales bacterium]|nr:hypothetical protein [Methylococcales bacterium]